MTTHFHLTPGHIGLNVSNLENARKFYCAVFGLETAAISTEPGREYALLSQDGDIVLTLWRQSDGKFSGSTPGLHHLAFRAQSLADVEASQERVVAAGGRILHGGIVPHREGASSGGIFFEDPDGIRLEVFTASGVEGREAPVEGAPTCGFF